MNKCEIKIGGRAWAQWLHIRGADALGSETDAMLKDRIERSFELANCPDTYKGQRLPYEPRSGPVWRDPVLVAFELGLQALCERLGVELHVEEYQQYDSGGYTAYLKKNSSAPRAEIVLDEYVKDCRIYEVNTDGPDGPREGFDE